MNSTNSNELTKAIDGLLFACGCFKNTLGEADPVEAIVISGLNERTIALYHEALALRTAIFNRAIEAPHD